MNLQLFLCCVAVIAIVLIIVVAVVSTSSFTRDVEKYELTSLDNDIISWMVQEVIFPPNSLYFTYNKTAPNELSTYLSNTSWNLLGDGYILASTPSRNSTSQFKMYCDENGYKGILTTDTLQIAFELEGIDEISKLQCTTAYDVAYNTDTKEISIVAPNTGMMLIGTLDGSFILKSGSTVISDNVEFEILDNQPYTSNYFTYANLSNRSICEIRDDKNIIVFTIDKNYMPTLTPDDYFCEYYAVLYGSTFSFTIPSSTPITVFGSLNEIGKLYTHGPTECGTFMYANNNSEDALAVLRYSLLNSTGYMALSEDGIEPHKHTTTLTTITNDSGHTHTFDSHYKNNSDEYYNSSGSTNQWSRQKGYSTDESNNEKSSESSNSHTHSNGTTASAGSGSGHRHNLNSALGKAYVYIWHRTDTTVPEIPSNITVDATTLIRSFYNLIFPIGSVVISASVLPNMSLLSGWQYLNVLGDFVLMTTANIDDKGVINANGDMYNTQPHIITEDETPTHTHPTNDSAVEIIGHNHGNNNAISPQTSTLRFDSNTNSSGYSPANAKDSTSSKSFYNSTVGDHTHEAQGKNYPTEDVTFGHIHALPYNYYSVHIYERINA